METKIVKVTPALAKRWLESNTINRPLRRSVVDGHIQAYMRGEHRLTHQGIAFAETGELLDGQHRLTAISEMPSTFSVDIMVTAGMPREAFDAIDQGLKRSHGDVLRIPAGLAANARYIATIYETSRVGITSQYLVPFVNGIEVDYDKLVGFCPKRTKTWSSAAIQAAAILRMMSGGDRDYISVTYYALNHMEFDSMPPIAQALFRQHTKGLVSSSGYDLFCRAFKAFDAKSQSLHTIQISDTSNIITKAREIIETRVLGRKPVAANPTKVPARSVASINPRQRAAA